MRAKTSRLLVILLCCVKLVLFISLVIISSQLLFKNSNKYTKWIEEKFDLAGDIRSASLKQRKARNKAAAYKNDMRRISSIGCIVVMIFGLFGAIAQLAGILGGCGYKCCMMISLVFDIVLLLVFIILLTFSGYMWYATSSYPKHLKSTMDGFGALFISIIQLRSTLLNKTTNIGIDMVQLNDDYECCGFFEYLDWYKPKIIIPKSKLMFSETTLTERTVLNIPSRWLTYCVNTTKLPNFVRNLCVVPSSCCLPSYRTNDPGYCNAATASTDIINVYMKSESRLKNEMNDALENGKIKPYRAKEIYSEGCIPAVLHRLSIVLLQITIVMAIGVILLLISAVAGCYVCCTKGDHTNIDDIM